MQALKKSTESIAGALVENNKYSISIHYRNVSTCFRSSMLNPPFQWRTLRVQVRESDVPSMERMVDEQVHAHPGRLIKVSLEDTVRAIGSIAKFLV